MNQNCWNIWDERGFLINPDPLLTLKGIDCGLSEETVDELEDIAATIPELLASTQIRPTLDNLAVVDLSPLREVNDFRIVERVHQLYSYYASSYVWSTHEEPAHHIPKGVAIPLVQVSEMVERPPILAYTDYVLNNWKRVDPNGEIELGNIALIQNFRGGIDEDWFILVHVDIEAHAAKALRHIQPALSAVENNDSSALESALTAIHESVSNMLVSFHRMPEHCDSDVYYYKVRPYIFGFTDVVYEGVVEQYNGKPQSFRGQTGAQSSIIPSLVAVLGIEHEQTRLTDHLNIMKAYMPKPHREFMEQVRTSAIREYVQAHAGNSALAEAYNECLRKVLEFRQLHYHYATEYIAQKVESPLGTGGTIFMDWLKQLADETEAQLV